MAESLALTDYKRLSNLRTDVHQDRNQACSEMRFICGLDTETDQNGDILVIADSEGNYLDKITLENIIRFLFSKRFQGSWNFFYHINFDAEVIVKILGEEILSSYSKTRKLRFKLEDFKIEYIPSKRLAIRKGHKSAIFFDIAQYYKSSLVEAYQNNIGKLDVEYLKMKLKRESLTRDYYKHFP